MLFQSLWHVWNTIVWRNTNGNSQFLRHAKRIKKESLGCRTHTYHRFIRLLNFSISTELKIEQQMWESHAVILSLSMFIYSLFWYYFLSTVACFFFFCFFARIRKGNSECWMTSERTLTSDALNRCHKNTKIAKAMKFFFIYLLPRKWLGIILAQNFQITTIFTLIKCNCSKWVIFLLYKWPFFLFLFILVLNHFFYCLKII